MTNASHITQYSKPVPRVRSALYVPGIREDFLAKADTLGADAIILDLEDSVADRAKPKARELCRKWIESRRPNSRPYIFSRLNSLGVGCLMEDLEAIVHSNVTAVIVPKVEGPDHVHTAEAAIAYVEGKKGVPLGHVRMWPLIEMAKGYYHSGEIAVASPRIAYMGGAAAREGDVANEMGNRYRRDDPADHIALETMYLRSKVLLEARAAGIQNPMTGAVTALDNMEYVEQFARFASRLGYEGMMVIHPSHVAIVNKVFAPSKEQVADAQGLLDEIDKADTSSGYGAVTYKGRMIDIPMVVTAKRIVEEARAFADA